MQKVHKFGSEAELCAAFTACIGKEWTAYNETAGWDILLVRNADGFQVGVQAKLKCNTLVLAQAADESRYAALKPGPDCRAILVPAGEVQVSLAFLCAYVGVTIIQMRPPGDRMWGRRSGFDPLLPKVGERWSEDAWYECGPAARCKLPKYIPDVPAGVKSPKTLTDWKVGALKINIIMAQRGHVTRQDFKDAGMDHRRWIARGNGWLQLVEDGRYVRGRYYPEFRAQHPVVTKQIEADMVKADKVRAEVQAALPL